MMNPLGCPGGQYEDGGRPWYLRFGISLGIIILVLILFPFVLVFAVPCVFTFACLGG